MLSSMGKTPPYKKNLYRFPLALIADLIDIKIHSNTMMKIEKACFPERMQEDLTHFYRFFKDKNALGLLLYWLNEPVGYVTATHAYDDMTDNYFTTSADLRETQKVTGYIDSIAVLEEYRSIKNLDFLLHELAVLMRDIDYRYLAAHVRKKNGFSRLMQRRYGAKVIKHYENWSEFNEPFDFILIDLKYVKTLPSIYDYFFHVLRIFYRFLHRQFKKQKLQ
ncbi:MAG: GNAT family N-acetyltransferase [Pseudomonadota bacterium]